MDNKFFNKKEYADNFRIYNSAAFSTPANYGAEQTITTMTRILEGVLPQKFYELNGQNLSRDFVPVVLGKNNYSQTLTQFATAQVGNNFEAGIVQVGNGINKDAQLDIVVDAISIPNNYWRMKYNVTNEILKQTSLNAPMLNYIEQQERARLKTWQLGIQKVAFKGLGDGRTYGLLNNPDVSVNTTLMPATLANMTIAQLNTFAQSAIAAYFANTNSTAMPNRLHLSTTDFMTLGTAVNPQYPVKNKKEYLLEAFKAATGDDNFKIVHSVYAANAGTGGTTRSMLYKHDPDTLAMYIMPYKPYPLFPQGALDMISDAEGQFTGVFVKRPAEVLYIDVT